MALKQYTFNEKRIKELNSTINQLLEAEDLYGKVYIIMIREWYSINILTSKYVDENIKYIYGYTENEEDLEWKLVKILFLFYLSKKIRCSNPNYANKINLMLSNIENKINILFQEEYRIIWPENSDGDNIKWIRYEPIETKTIIDNLGDIQEKIVDPIIELLKPMKSDKELIANISLSHAEMRELILIN